MTREEMIKIKWHAYMSIDYQDQGMKFPAECLLTAVDFDAELLTLTPLNDFYEQRQFPAAIQFCTVSKRMKVATIEGKKIDDPRTNELKAKKIGVWIEDDNLNDAS